MSVITTDVLVEGVKRVDVLDWLSKPDNHGRILEGAFDALQRTGDQSWDLTLKVAPKTRVIGYTFDELDQSHGGRRVICHTTGKRTAGTLHFSLRTMRPSTNTLVTLHSDYAPGGALGELYDVAILRKALEARWKRVLDNLQREVMKDFDL